ncbi:hypothetical protein OG539_02850 [Actinacidiphila glaucinigra]|nr:hypothetical protein [Actinacidiphila glaucinigra]WSD64648.1 hypothetical protein OIE69_40010 [Actinacidiphila glaucinigra]
MESVSGAGEGGAAAGGLGGLRLADEGQYPLAEVLGLLQVVRETEEEEVDTETPDFRRAGEAFPGRRRSRQKAAAEGIHKGIDGRVRGFPSGAFRPGGDRKSWRHARGRRGVAA